MSSSANTQEDPATSSLDQSSSSSYQAPYKPNSRRLEGHYDVVFKEGYTLAQHFAFLGREIELEAKRTEGYYAELDNALFQAVRRDPGVQSIEGYGSGKGELNESANRAPTSGSPDQCSSTSYQAPYNQIILRDEDHYVVVFKDGYTLAQHFTFLGREFKPYAKWNEGYYVELDRELFEAVRRDPGVKLVEDDVDEGWGPSEEELMEAAMMEDLRERVTTEDCSSLQYRNRLLGEVHRD